MASSTTTLFNGFNLMLNNASKLNGEISALKIKNDDTGKYTTIDSQATSDINLNFPPTQGTTDDVLANTGTDGNTEWKNLKDVLSLTNKGDLLTYDGSSSSLKVLPKGCDGYVLTADSKADNGVDWQPIPSDVNLQKLKSLDTYLFNFELENTPTVLMQSDFDNGTYRIKESGVYHLGEDIEFNPNPGNDHFPTQQQIDDGDYPVQPNGPYHLGFFAALSIETEYVVLRGNGYTLKQSKAHQLQQRHYMNIALASVPFQPGQGPSVFGPLNSAKNCKIYDLIIGNSSHHCLHGLNPENIILEDITFTDYELAGFHLNGSKNVLLKNLHINQNDKFTPILATYSQARFIRPFLQAIIDTAPPNGPSVNIKGVAKTGLEILNELQVVMDNVYEVFVNENGSYSGDATSLFVNSSVGLDGGIYGFVLNTAGIAVDKFIRTRDALEGGNENIFIENITVENIENSPDEVIALTAESNINQYGAILQKGPVGDVFRIKDVTNPNGTYKPNVLANAQIYIASAGVGAAQRGGTSIDPEVVAWASSPGDTIIAGTHYFNANTDSMAHDIKGTIAVFISGVTNLQSEGLIVRDVKNTGERGNNQDGFVNPETVQNPDEAYEGSNCRGVAVVSSKNCVFKKTQVSDIKSLNGSAKEYDLIGENINIKFE